MYRLFPSSDVIIVICCWKFGYPEMLLIIDQIRLDTKRIPNVSCKAEEMRVVVDRVEFCQ